MIYKTETGRFVVAKNNLASAINSNGFVNLSLLTERDKTHDAPTLLLAQLIAEAQAQLAKPGAEANMVKELSVLAEAAALNAAWCCANPCPKLDRLHFTHLAETDKGRWALSTKPIPALDPKRPGLICEDDLSPEQLANTCFIADKTVATFLATAMGHRFSDQTGPHAYFIVDEREQVFCRHEQGLPLSAMNTLPEREQAIHLQSAELQLLLAKTYRNVSNLIAQNTP